MLDTTVKTIKTPIMSVVDSTIIDSQSDYACPICGTTKLLLITSNVSKENDIEFHTFVFNCGNGHCFTLSVSYNFALDCMKIMDMHQLKRGRVPYDEYLHTQGWLKKSYAAKVRAGWKCGLDNKPGNEATLNTHHKTYENIGHEKDDDLIVLCQECHGKFHGKEEA